DTSAKNASDGRRTDDRRRHEQEVLVGRNDHPPGRGYGRLDSTSWGGSNGPSGTQRRIGEGGVLRPAVADRADGSGQRQQQDRAEAQGHHPAAPSAVERDHPPTQRQWREPPHLPKP